jgi:hypothetical protein
MSSLRPAKIVEALLDFLGGSRSAQEQGPGCSCESCEQAWRRNHQQVTALAREKTKLTVARH